MGVNVLVAPELHLLGDFKSICAFLNTQLLFVEAALCVAKMCFAVPFLLAGCLLR